MNGQPPLKMRLSLDVLQHLGLNLYSNVPAVLSEIVANAWDADAKNVRVDWDGRDRIVIQDDGIGMTRADVIDRFLLVGYQRRREQRGATPLGRSPMGRKGIGKLSLFSIAEDIVVETVRDGQKTALRMRLDAVKGAIEDGEAEYEPEELPISQIDFARGTRITLCELRKRQTIRTAESLRKRLARRFSIIGPSYDFTIVVNEEEITPEDRGYYDRLQYIWTYGDQSLITALCNNLEKEEIRDSEFEIPDSRKLKVSGWLGTVRESKQLRDDQGENLNRIAIFVRGKMAQEDLLGDFTERGVYATYLIGELRVDGLDTDAGPGSERDEDSATSSRQRIVEDDPRYVALKEFVGQELKSIEKAWSDLRVKAGIKTALEIPEVGDWIRGLPSEFSRKAERWLGKINRIKVDDPAERRQLMKHAVLAFEFHRWNENLDELDSIGDENLESVIQMFRELDSLEITLYGLIVRERIAIIKALQDKVDQNARERAIQAFIFDHLWLLDPSWERVESSAVMEKRVGNLFTDVDAALSPEEQNARLDIGYRETAGKHVIIELKKPDRTVSVYDLARQINKYRSGMLKILERLGTPHEPVEFVCLLGKEPTEWSTTDGKSTVEEVLKAHNARFVLYDQLLDHAYQSYSDYFRKEKDLDQLGKLIDAIDDYSEDRGAES